MKKNKPIRSAATYGLSHLAISVRDIQRTKEFYQRIFEMEVMYEEDDFLQMTTPGANDILVFEKKENTGHTGNIAHFGFRLRKKEHFKEIRDKINATGAKIVSEGEFVPGSPYIFFRDPDGYELEVWYEVMAPALLEK